MVTPPDIDLISGGEALTRLDAAVAKAQGDFSTAVAAAEGASSRRSELVRLRAEAYQELARIRLDVVQSSAAEQLSAAEGTAKKLLADHAAYLEGLAAKTAAAAAAVSEIESRRKAAAEVVDRALEAYESQVAATEARLTADRDYLAIKARVEELRAVAARSAQKLELAKADRLEKGAPYEGDPLFAYLWKRRLRTTDYKGRGLIRLLDNWVARTCGYDAAYLNYARLVELPQRLAEHVGQMKLDEEEAKAAIGRYESAALATDGAEALSTALRDARDRLKAVDAELSAAEAKRADLRVEQEQAAAGQAGPHVAARKALEAVLAKASFPDLRVLAAETTTTDDDRIVDALIRLRTEELQMEINWRNVDVAPQRRRGAADALELVRQRFKDSGLDSPYVSLGKGAFNAAIMAYGLTANPDAEALWRAVVASVREAPRQDDDYFGGPRRGRTIGLGPVAGLVVGAALGELLAGGRGRWGGGGWSGGGWGSGGDWGGGSDNGGGGDGGFSTGGDF